MNATLPASVPHGGKMFRANTVISGVVIPHR
jgi:hypothetical protein